MRLGELLEQLAQRFAAAPLCYGHGTDNPGDEAFYLVFSALQLDFNDQAAFALELKPEQVTWLMDLARRRVVERVPVAYLVGEAWFAGLPFHVTPDVLIPRSPMAELIANNFAGLMTSSPRRVLDLCTGSGCIGIATALSLPGAQVDLADISLPALDVARRNVLRHGLQARVQLHHSDLFAELPGGYDLILSNPPYVSAEEVAALPREYQHEPALGLLSADDGLAIPLQILQQAAGQLNAGGLLVLELGYSWPLLAQRLPQVPWLWLSFEHGGEGVLAISRETLQRHFP